MSGQSISRIDTILMISDKLNIENTYERLNLFGSYRNFRQNKTTKVSSVVTNGPSIRSVNRLSNLLVKKLCDYKGLYIHDRHYDIADEELSLPFRGIKYFDENNVRFRDNFFNANNLIEFIKKH